jgi:hypothetical protein
VLGFATLAGCGDARARPAASALPAAEFLLVSDDSTVWVRTGADGARVQRSPLVIADVGGRLVELFATDATREHEGATFSWGRLWSRDVVRGDSALVYEEPVLRAEAVAYARTHPDDPAIDPEEVEGGEGAPYAASATVTLLDVTGPLAGIEVHVDRWRDDSLVQHDSRWLTLSLDARAPVTLAALVGDDEAARQHAEARATLARAARDAAQLTAPGAERASAVLRALAIDDDGFVLVARDDSAAIRFLAHAPDADDAHRWVLPAQRITAPSWWGRVRTTLPRTGADTLRAELRHGALALETRDDTAGVATVRIAGGATLLRMAGPVRRLIPLGSTLAVPESAWRPALERAFAEAGYYSDDVRAVRRAGPRQARGRLRVASALGRRPRRAVAIAQ